MDPAPECGRGLLQHGTITVDERAPGLDVRVLFTLEHIIGGASSPARRRADDLRERLEQRMAQPDREARILAPPPFVIGGLVVVPMGLIAAMTGPTCMSGSMRTSDDGYGCEMVKQVRRWHSPGMSPGRTPV